MRKKKEDRLEASAAAAGATAAAAATAAGATAGAMQSPPVGQEEGVVGGHLELPLNMQRNSMIVHEMRGIEKALGLHEVGERYGVAVNYKAGGAVEQKLKRG